VGLGTVNEEGGKMGPFSQLLIQESYDITVKMG